MAERFARLSGRRASLGAVAGLLLLAGCGTGISEIYRHPNEPRLEAIRNRLAPVKSDPEAHYWVRVCDPTKQKVGLAVLFQRHIYIAQPIAKQADEKILTALVAHGMAHHRLHHLGKRSGVLTLQSVAFKIGGNFVPGLGYGKYATEPLSEVAMGSWQEMAADAKTVEYLKEIGYTGKEWLDALIYLQDQGYSERVSQLVMRGSDFTGRIAKLKKETQ